VPKDNNMSVLQNSRTRTISVATIVRTIILLAIIATVAFAKPYDSFNGKFRIDLPSNWTRMDYRTVDYYLKQTSEGNDLLEYEAVFSPAKPGVFYDREYLMLTVDTIGKLSRRQIDSVLSDMGEAFELPLERKPITNFATDIPPGKFLYDDERQIAAVATPVYDAGEIYKISLLAVKFYDEGVANFYFFSADTSYTELATVFHEIISSFRTEGLEARTNTPVPVADIKPESDEPNWIPYAVGAGVVLLLGVVFLAIRKSSKNEKA